ncbi:MULTISPECIES: GntR family transcriptional regulator [Allobacillus]|uniref:GntR family transcriptional regulator n=1 Tax=Allobacillus salarius TaxID=1955272 RepID=A0A556PGP2_9BACI|nr:GntR family transcriptional regulator [Allobacillus salarius]TSJ63505.1 GntR family transcriptional regulator [Allobacillus salarius]
MRRDFDEGKPIFQQVRERIEDQIVNNQLKEGDQAPSTNQLVQFYEINHVTVAKGVNQLVDEGILFKKRGVGMFVAEGAKSKLVQKRRDAFMDNYVSPMVQEAEKLAIEEKEMLKLIRKIKRGEENES